MLPEIDCPEPILTESANPPASRRAFDQFVSSESAREHDSFDETLDAQPTRVGRTALFVRKTILAICGQYGAIGISLVALTIGFSLHPVPWSIMVEAGVAIILIRLAYLVTRGPKPVLRAHTIRKRARWVLVDEAKISAAFLSVCYLLDWPVGRLTVGLFVAFNLCLQLAMLWYSRLMLAGLSRQAQRLGNVILKRRAIIVGTGPKALEIANQILDSPDVDTQIIGFLDYHKKSLWRYRDIPFLGHPEQLREIATNGQLDALFIAVEPEDVSNAKAVFTAAEEMGVPVFLMPDVFPSSIAFARSGYFCGMATLIYRSVPDDHFTLLAKSMIDRVGAIFGLLMAAPMIIGAALAIKLDSRGPVFFAQVRVGLNGKTFRLYKFRTMCRDAEQLKAQLAGSNEMSGPVFKMKDDPRITRVGRFLRRYSIDELPQLFNVLHGDMSLVGPRPALPKEVCRFKPWQHRKLAVKPGVTCIWQVSGRNNIDFEDWMRLDLNYIDNWSLWLDAKILAKTVPAVLRGSGM